MVSDMATRSSSSYEQIEATRQLSTYMDGHNDLGRYGESRTEYDLGGDMVYMPDLSFTKAELLQAHKQGRCISTISGKKKREKTL
jgi:hypothetical protein